MNHYIYLITNNINNKRYIGKRSCYCSIEEDKYMGSGKYLWNAINKYGIENFSKDILLICKSEEQALEIEKKAIELVNATKNPMYYNIAEGGHGGNVIAGFSKEERREFGKKISESMKGRYIGELSSNSKICVVEIDNIIYVKTTRAEMIEFIIKEFGFVGIQNWFSKNREVPLKYNNRVSLVMVYDKNKYTIYHMNENCKLDLYNLNIEELLQDII